jgi:hypothetical protein
MRSRYLCPQRRLEVPCPTFPEDSMNLARNFVGENVGNAFLNMTAKSDTIMIMERNVPAMLIQSVLLLSTVLTSYWLT